LRAYCLEPEQLEFSFLMFPISPLIIGVKNVIALMESERKHLL